MPDAATHPSPQELAAYGLGKLPADATAAVARHLESCPRCLQLAAQAPADSFLDKVRAAGPTPADTRLPPPLPALPPAGLPAELAQHPKFHIVRELGRGGMGVIYLAQHRVMNKPVALKAISRAVLSHPNALARFHAEVQAAGKLDHPNIARAHDADQAGDLHFLVLEYVEGSTLAQLVGQHGPLPVAEAGRYVHQAALALQHAFEQGTVHRDVKPANLMVTPQGQLKVLDFGLARLGIERHGAGRLTQVGALMGTPEYMAPEQATDPRKADTRADIYSLGCTLYFVLAGRSPFGEGGPAELVLAHLRQEPAALHGLRPEVPAELSAVVARMLAKDPAQRYQTPIEVARALAPFVKGGPQAAARPSAALPPPGVSSAGRGTLLPADTRRIEEPGAAAPPPVRRRSPRPAERSPIRARVDVPARAPRQVGAWRKQLAVLAVLACAALVLGGMVAIFITAAREGPAAANVSAEARKPIPAKTPSHVGPAARGPTNDPKPPDTKREPSDKREPITVINRDESDPRQKEGRRPIAPKVVDRFPVRPGGTGRARVEGDALVLDDLDHVPACANIYFGDTEWVDYDFQADVKRLAGNTHCALWFRHGDPANQWCYSFGKGSHLVTLENLESRWWGGIQTDVGPIGNENWYTLRVSVRGQEFRCFVDGRPTFTQARANHPRGCVGFHVNGSRFAFRNIKVTAPDGAVLLAGLPDLSPPAPGKASKDDPAKAVLTQRQKRMLRWTLHFNTNNGPDYVGQLHGLGAILAIPVQERPEPVYKVVSDLARRPARLLPEDVSKIQRIYWIDNNPQSVGDAMAALGLPLRPSYFVAFLPEEVENRLFELEKAQARGRPEDDIHETRFRVKAVGGRCEVEFVSISFK
jgi:hypothetical protein